MLDRSSQERKEPDLITNNLVPSDREQIIQLNQEDTATGPRRGRPRLDHQTPEKMWQEELMQVVLLARQARQFASKELRRLQDASEGADSIKTKLAITKAAVELLTELTKVSGMLVNQVEKKPSKQAEDAEFDVEKFLKEIK